MLFSKETGGFYDASIHGENVPDDVVEITNEHHQKLIAGQSQGKRIQSDNSGFPILVEPPPPTIEFCLRVKHTEINQWRDKQEQASVEHNDHRWDADPTSRARIESVLLAGAMPLDYWTDADNIDRPMTLEQLRALYAAIVQQGGRIHDRQRQMKTEVAALTTIEAVQAYPIGWPIEEPA